MTKLMLGVLIVMVVGLLASDIYRIVVLKQHVYTKPVEVSNGLQHTH